MMGSLFGGKFSNKCKHGVKCIRSRLELIKKKKQAMVQYLKRDVAELMANGHDNNAFGRIEALIIEINHASCYNMIEHYCECIFQQLPSLQKQRECTDDAKEAVSTLIYAAARFSDLPELCDLRTAFTERYDSHMESSINQEFVEKLQKKTFSTEQKLQLMKNIADEFSVRWDLKAFQLKLTRGTTTPALNTALKQDQSKISHQSKDRLSYAENLRNTSNKEKKEAHINAPKERCEPSSKNLEQAKPDSRDIHVVRHDPAQRNMKIHAAVDMPEIMPSVKPNASQSKRTDENAKALPYIKPKRSEIRMHRHAFFDETDTKNESPIARKEPGLIGIEKKGAAPVAVTRDVNAVNMIHHVELPKPASQESLPRTATPSLMNRMPPYAINRPPPYTKPNVKISDHADNDDAGERPKPFSVRREHPKDPIVAENENVRRNGDNIDERKIEDRQQRPPRQDERKHRSSRQAQRDEAEQAMDRLLVHFSKKGTRTRSRDAAADHRPVRISSLPSEPTTSVAEDGRGIHRTASLQADVVHPRLPDYDDLAARFNALKKV